MKTTKNDSTIADWEKEFEYEWGDSMSPGNLTRFKVILLEALQRQREEIVKSLRMDERSPVNEYYKAHAKGPNTYYSVNEVDAYNKAVNEFNEKLDKLK